MRCASFFAASSRSVSPLLLALAAIVCGVPLRAAQNDHAVEPFRIVGNLYSIGGADVTSFLITTPAGHVVIDSGYEEMAPAVLENIRRLGFKPEDVRVLLCSHAHFDH